MACCGGGASSVVILGSGATEVTGSGSATDPYIISANLDVVVRGTETETAKTTVVGSGTSADPYVITVVSTVALNDLLDVSSTGTAEVDDVLKFDGSSWVFGPAPVSAGSVNATGGIEGQGTGGNPLKINVSNAVATSTAGLYTYIDSAGELRAEVPASAAVSWGDILSKPSTFTPTAHTHSNADLTGLLKGTAAPTSGQGVDGAIYVQYV